MKPKTKDRLLVALMIFGCVVVFGFAVVPLITFRYHRQIPISNPQSVVTVTNAFSFIGSRIAVEERNLVRAQNQICFIYGMCYARGLLTSNQVDSALGEASPFRPLE